MSGHAYLNDSKRLAFTLSRYKFVSKMLAGKNLVLEVGCADAFGSSLVYKEVEQLFACDFDPVFINDVKKVTHSRVKLNFLNTTWLLLKSTLNLTQFISSMC